MSQKKNRVPIPDDVAAEILFLSNRTCCICTIPGKPIQIHHVDENPANNDLDNLAVLCLDSHNDTMLKGGFSRKLDSLQVVKYKMEWLERIKTRKSVADNLASISVVTDVSSIYEYVDYKGEVSAMVLLRYLNNILVVHKAQWMIAKARWDGGNNSDIRQGLYALIDFYEEVLNELSTFYVHNHFTSSPSKYFREVISSRYSWHRLVVEPYGQNTGGTMAGISTSSLVQNDLLNMVSQIATELIYKFDLYDNNSLPWRDEWLGPSK